MYFLWCSFCDVTADIHTLTNVKALREMMTNSHRQTAFSFSHPSLISFCWNSLGHPFIMVRSCFWLLWGGGGYVVGYYWDNIGINILKSFWTWMSLNTVSFLICTGYVIRIFKMLPHRVDSSEHADFKTCFYHY